eukprot:CFRG8584T1
MKTQKRISQLAYKKNRPKQVGGYLYVPQFSSPTLAVYRNRRGKIIVGIRGTKLTSADDLKADWKILRGKNLRGTARYKEAELLIRKLMRDYGEENVELTGLCIYLYSPIDELKHLFIVTNKNAIIYE